MTEFNGIDVGMSLRDDLRPEVIRIRVKFDAA
jgi:hypothetical protein